MRHGGERKGVEGAWGVIPRRRMPERVIMRGSSHPDTWPPCTSCSSLRLDITALVMFSREYSHTTGLYIPSTCTCRGNRLPLHPPDVCDV